MPCGETTEKSRRIKAAYQALEEAHVNLKAAQTQLIQSEKKWQTLENSPQALHEIQNP